MKWRLDLRSFNQNVRNCEVAWKKSFGALTGFRPVPSAFALQCFSSWAMKVFYQLRADYLNLHFINKLKVYLTNKCYPVSEWVCFCIVSAVVTWVSGFFWGGGAGAGAGGRRGVEDRGVQKKARKKKASPFLLPPPPQRKAWYLGYLYCESTETASGTEDEWNLFHIFLNFWQRFWCYRRWCRLRFNPRMIFKSVSGVNIIPIKNYCWKSESVARANPELHFRIETEQADI